MLCCDDPDNSDTLFYRQGFAGNDEKNCSAAVFLYFPGRIIFHLQGLPGRSLPPAIGRKLSFGNLSVLDGFLYDKPVLYANAQNENFF